MGFKKLVKLIERIESDQPLMDSIYQLISHANGSLEYAREYDNVKILSARYYNQLGTEGTLSLCKTNLKEVFNSKDASDTVSQKGKEWRKEVHTALGYQYKPVSKKIPSRVKEWLSKGFGFDKRYATSNGVIEFKVARCITKGIYPSADTVIIRLSYQG